MTSRRGIHAAAGIALGAYLSLTPFLRYGSCGGQPGAHLDHAPHYGGVLGMVGDRHLEIVRAGGRVECYPSDARRRPLALIGGQVECDDGRVIAAVAADGRLVAPDRCLTREITCHVILDEGDALRMSAAVAGR